VPGQERLDEGSEGRSFLEQEPVPGIGVEHEPCPGDEAGEDVVIGDRGELVGLAVPPSAARMRLLPAVPLAAVMPGVPALLAR
jgi:hypothetical protein